MMRAARAARARLLAAALLCASGAGLAQGAAAPPAAAASAPDAAATPEADNTAVPLHAPPPASVVTQPRAFGYMLGDVFDQRILLERDGRALVPAALPQRERVGNWFTRREVGIEHEAATGRSWLHVQYQVVNVPPVLSVLRVPAWTLPIAPAGTPALAVADWPVSVAPFTLREAPTTEAALGALRADRGPDLPERAPIERLLRWGALALALDLLAWGAWWRWRNWRAHRERPFARAQHALRRLDPAQALAWRTLHAAFDQAAGCAVQTATLDVLFARAPYLLPARARVADFFEQSNHIFFGGGAPPPALSLTALSAELCRLERGAEA